MKNTISKPRPSPISSGRTSPAFSTQMRPDSPRSMKSSGSSASQTSRVVVGQSNGPSQCPPARSSLFPPSSDTCAPQRPPRPEELAAATRPQVYQPPPTPSKSSPARSSSSFTSPPKPPVLRRLSTATTLQRHLSIANSTSVLPFSTKRRPSIPVEDFPTSPDEDDWEDFSFEEDLGPISPVRNVIRRKSSVPLSPRLTRGAGLSRSQASRRTRRSRNNLNSRGPATPIDHNRPLSVYSAYSFYTPSQIDDDDEDFGHVIRSPDPASSFMNINADSLSDQEDWNEFGEVPAGANLEPRGSVSSIATIRPPADQRNPSRLGGLKDKLRCQWLGHRSGQGQEMSSDESLHNRSGSDVSLSPSAGAASNRPAYSRARTTPNRPVVFNKPGFKSLSKSSQTPSDFRPGHGYQSSTDSSSYAPSFSSFENNIRIGGKSGSSSCGDDWTSEEGHDYTAKPLPASRASSIVSPAPPVHSRNNSDNYAHLRPNSVSFVEPIRKPAIRIKNGVPHHSCDPEEVPYPLSYSSNMLEADRWNHALLFGDERNPANAGGLLRGSTVSFSQFYGVGSGKKEVLKGKELRGGKVLDLGCGEGLWVLAAAKEWKHTCFVGFDLLPIQMDLKDKLDGTKNAQDIMDRIEWVQGDFLNEKLPFADNSFDLVRLANTTLALPTDANTGNYRLRSLFGEIFRVLKVNGEFEMIDEKHTVPSASQASPSCPDNAAFDPYAGTQMRQLEQAFARMLQHHELSAYDTIPNLLRQHFSTSSEKATFRLAVAPEQSAVDNPRRRDDMGKVASRVDLDRDLGIVENQMQAPAHGRGQSFSGSLQGRNRKMLQLLGKEYAESHKPSVPQGLIVLPHKILPMSPAAVYAHATHSTNIILNAKEQLFSYIEDCTRGKAVADRREFDDLLWDYEASRFSRVGLRDPLQSFKDWETGISDANEGLWSGEQRSPRFASSPPPDGARVGSMGPLPSWRYESESDVVTVREIRVCLARKLSSDPPSAASN
ncbi:Methyltransferase domain [Rhizoctonia solani]|uniref:Methyltransferase domain n=1 Tax=Rhizoctonia solani TaxID=456999 RepID=A0A8H7HGD7_9AGAM|nr:Methyltransferase domain [Rhizoctonia solani]